MEMNEIKNQVLKKTELIDYYVLEMIQKTDNMNYISLSYVMDIYENIEKYILYINNIYINHFEFNPYEDDISPNVLTGALFYLLYSKSTLYNDFISSIDEKFEKLNNLEFEINKMIENKEHFYSMYYINRIKLEQMFNEIDFFYKMCIGNISNFENIISPTIDKVSKLHEYSRQMCILIEKIKPYFDF